MSAQVRDFQSPVPQPAQEVQFQDEWTPRYGILVGGVKEIPWNGVGEQSITSGDQTIYRRVWKVFERIQVGRRNEFEGALDMPMNAIQLEWSKNPDRIQAKSPRACAQDVLVAHKEQGYCVPTVLIGHADPKGLTEKVWPREIRDALRLFQHVAYFETFQTDNEDEAKLAGELLAACYTSRDYLTEYVRMIKTEMTKEKGLRNLNPNLEEMFREINEPLPEQRANLAAQEMGKEIVKAAGSDGRKDDAIIGALNAITSRLEMLEQPATSGQGSDPNNEEASAQQTSNTQPRRRADGSLDRRYK